MRAGIGYDVHGFDATCPLVLGGVTIEDAPGLAGWSDADVVCHAVIDAALGAAALGDLGEHFPEDAVPEGASSLEMLARTADMVREAGYEFSSVDVTVMIQDVRVGPYRKLMAERVAESLAISSDLVSIKATTTDRLGFIGRGEGAGCTAVVLVENSVDLR